MFPWLGSLVEEMGRHRRSRDSSCDAGGSWYHSAKCLVGFWLVGGQCWRGGTEHQPGRREGRIYAQKNKQCAWLGNLSWKTELLLGGWLYLQKLIKGRIGGGLHNWDSVYWQTAAGKSSGLAQVLVQGSATLLCVLPGILNIKVKEEWYHAFQRI